ncbi:MAG: hypothetical protein OH318_01745 [Candidatus Parvarchaeota archaeon]|nr:hypothetical protein [Candidatus Rehaiarchaeum fermentans]
MVEEEESREEVEENTSPNIFSFMQVIRNAVDLLVYNAQKCGTEINRSGLEKTLNNTKKKNNSSNNESELNLALYNSYLKSLNWISKILGKFPGYEQVKLDLINYEDFLNSNNYKRIKNTIKEFTKKLLYLENSVGKLFSSIQDIPIDDRLGKLLECSITISSLEEVIKLELYTQDLKASKKDIISNLKQLNEQLYNIYMLYAYYEGFNKNSINYNDVLIPKITKKINKKYLLNYLEKIDKFMDKLFDEIGKYISSNYSLNSRAYM